MNISQTITGLCLVALLSACGGGDGGGTAPVAGPVTPPAATVFQFKAALANSFNKSSSLPLTISGTVNKVAVTGSGTMTKGTPTAAIFEGIVALKKVSTFTGSMTGNGQTFPVSFVGISYTDSNYLPIGSSDSDEYTVVTGSATVPATAKINDTGNLFTAKRYKDSTKAVLIGTVTSTFVLEPDTSTTGLLKIIEVEKGTTGAVTSIATTTLRLTVNGVITYISEAVLDADGDTLTFIFGP